MNYFMILLCLFLGFASFIYRLAAQPSPRELSPSARFSASKTTICEQEAIRFADESENIPTKWHWSFPGGSPSYSSFPTPVVKYKNAGLYEVKLTVANKSGNDSLIKTNYVNVITCKTMEAEEDKLLDLSKFKIIPDQQKRSIILAFNAERKCNLLIRIVNDKGETIYLEHVYKLQGFYEQTISLSGHKKGKFTLEISDDLETENRRKFIHL